MRKIELNGIEFEMQKRMVVFHPEYLKSLTTCYDKPSARKRAIYEDWRRTAETDFGVPAGASGAYGTGAFGIQSHNIYWIVIGFYFEWLGHTWYAEITPRHNRLYKVWAEASDVDAGAYAEYLLASRGVNGYMKI